MRRGAVAAVLIVAGCLAGCRQSSDPPEALTPIGVRCAPASRRPIAVTTTLRGRVTAPPGGELAVASQVAGRIDRVLVREGDRVGEGTLLAVVDESASRDALRQADSALAQAKAAEVDSIATLQRTKELVARGIAAKQELDDATAREDQSRAGVSAAAAALDLARRTLGRVQIRSTFGGVVTRIWRGAGALVDGTAATPIVELAASSAAEFEVDATEQDLLGLEAGQRATVTLTAGGPPLEGVVRARGAALDPVTGLGIARIVLERGSGLVLGLFGTAVVQLGTRDGALVVPSDAMRGAVADGAEVVVCKGREAEVRTIVVGWRDDRTVEVRGGLQDGEHVAVDHVLGLQTGTPILEAN